MSKNLFLFTCLFVFGSFSFARTGPPPGGAKRGGVGFLFEDFGGFSNPGQKANFKGFAVEAQYETVLNTPQKTVTPSVVWGKGGFGVAGFVSRTSHDISSPHQSTDTIGGAMGLGLASNRLTVGVGFSRSIDTAQTSNGTLTASMNWNGLGGKGFHLGIGGSSTVNRTNRDIKTATVALGWGFGRTAIEAVYSMEDLQDPAMNYEASGYLTWEGDSFFTGLGGGYEKGSSSAFAAGRLGVKLGKVDASVFGNKSFVTGANPSIGASLRVKF